MRIGIILLATILVVTGLRYADARRPDGLVAADTATVMVDIRCTGDRIRQSVTPWELEINQGDAVEWRLHPSAHSTTIEITPKQEAWPFLDGTRHRGRADAPARATRMRPNQRGLRFQYAITLVCPQGGQQDTVVIDPDIVIR